MIKIFDSFNIDEVFVRAQEDYAAVEDAVKEIITRVREEGDKALKEYTLRFDGANLDSLQCTEEEIDGALSRVDKDFLKVLETAKENITQFHRCQIRQGFRIEREDGVFLGQRILPLNRVGIYVPGGTAAYPSTVLMNAIPAKLAGVNQIIMVTPPRADGMVKDEILAAAALAGVDKIYKAGGAQAVAALAYGTESVPKVDKITGPGNIYVATAKRLVFGDVDIDMIAGPSEILIIADRYARPDYLAADMLSQAEHDSRASAVLVTDSAETAKAAAAEIERQLALLPRREIARASIESNGKIIVVKNLEQAVELANELAPEHLEICTQNPFELMEKTVNAASVFLGGNTPEALGDYIAGPNHTLPTGGRARYSSPLSVDDFIKKSSYIFYTENALKKVASQAAEFANREGLAAHARSIEIRAGQNE